MTLIGPKNIKPVLLLAALSLAVANLATAAETKPTSTATPQFSVFDMPAMSKQLAFVLGNLKKGNFDRAEQSLRKIIAKYPTRDQNHYLLATILATRNKPNEALAALTQAVDNGFKNTERMQKDPNLKSIRSTPGFMALSERILKENATGREKDTVKIAPYFVKSDEALVSSSNTIWNPKYGVLLSLFEFNSRDDAPSKVQDSLDPVALQLNDWFWDGDAAGNVGDLYDNRDHKHSSLKKTEYPQFAFTKYSAEAKKEGIDYGLNTKVMFNAPTLGNSSTGINGLGSQANLAYVLPFAAQRLFLQYVHSHLYVYPAVTDYGDKNGDVLSASTPYMIMSFGKSGSDRPFLKAIASILAAFKPDVKDALSKNNLLMPTVQMIFRQGQRSVQKPGDYLTYRAHPPVFDSQNLDVLRMVHMAQQMELDKIPPMVSLSLVSESLPEKGVDDFSRIRSETLFKTPAAIARVVRSTAQNTTIMVSAEKTKAPAGQKLTYEWVVLRGDAKRISITPKNSEGSVAEITVPWHGDFPAPERPEYQTNRVEIGVFVNNGHYYSAPSFISFLYPANQKRLYTKSGKIAAIEHRPIGSQRPVIDPQIFTKRDWRDDYSYDDEGSLTGWRRTRGNTVSEFTADGMKVISRDGLGRPVQAEIIKYVLENKRPVHRHQIEQPTGSFVTYEYENDADKTGTFKQD
jgi:Tetratricopeptide repeat